MIKKMLIPGPVELSDGVLRAMAQPMMGHRTPDFEKILEECWSGLQRVYKTKNEVALITGSGTAAMDAAVASTIEEGDEYVCVAGGKFGERFVEIVKSYGGKPILVDTEWGKGVDPAEVREAVENSDAKAITLVHNETSTGVLHDAEAIGKIARENDLLFIMDAVTSLGGDYVEVDRWGIDLCVAGSQKCLAAPPGLAMVSMSKRALEAIRNNATKNYYLNLASYSKSTAKKTTPFTPSVSLIYGLIEALREIEREGVDNRITRHRKLAKATRAAIKAMGLELLASDKDASNTVTAIKAPGIADDVRKKLKEDFGILLAGGQDRLKGNIFRIGHMGNIGYLDMVSVLGALELGLKALGKRVELGAGVAAAQAVFGK